MNRVAYCASKLEFIYDVQYNFFIPKMKEGAIMNHIPQNESEIRSWESNAPKIMNLLTISAVPDDTYVSFEYKVPNGGRIDCMIYGQGKDNTDNIIHIELKQWSNNSVEELYSNGIFKVNALTGGSYRPVCHPSQQVANYQQHLLNYIEELNKEHTHLEGLAYCYNYYKNCNPNALYATHYKAILDEQRLFSADEIDQLASRINLLLYKGSGLSIFNRITNSAVKPSKSLIEAAAGMFKGITEFALIDDQIIASQTIFAEVQKALMSNKKTAIIVKGGPGTGKTVIALHVLAQMAQRKEVINMRFTTRSKALRESLKQQLRDVQINNNRTNNASDLIANIYKIKPYHYRESELDLLLVDEAHRVEKSSNHMTDAFEEQTYLSQATSLMYCSKVCVFFIDDYQAVKSSEIGNSNDLVRIAHNYPCEIASYENSRFYKDLLRKQQTLNKKTSLRNSLICFDDCSKLSSLDSEIAQLKREIDRKKDCWKDVKSTYNGKIRTIEIELKSQFRCNGSDNYLDWLDAAIYKGLENIFSHFTEYEYDFKIFDTPQSLYDCICEKNKPYDAPKKVARLAAGYCWTWSTKLERNGDLVKDVKIGDFQMPWETNNVQAKGEFRTRYASSADTWAIEPEGINQIGCIFSVQGFELDYIGVILGPDIAYDRMNKRLIAVPGINKAAKTTDIVESTRLILNAYRVLMSRGKKGCYIYCTDHEVADYFRAAYKLSLHR